MKINHYGNLKISFELNLGPCEEQNGTYGEEKKGQRNGWLFLTDPYAFTMKILG